MPSTGPDGPSGAVDPDDDDVVTAADVDALNAAAVERSAAIARAAGSVVVAIGVAGALAWAWVAVRAQQRANELDFSFGSDGVPGATSFGDRMELLAASWTSLVVAAATVAVGLLLRVVGDYAQTRVGGSVTGYRVGDRLADDDARDRE